MVTSSKRAYAIPRSTAPRAPAPAAVHCWPIPLQETLKHSSVSVSVVSGSWFTQGLFEPSEHLWRVGGLILNAILSPYHLVGASPLPLDVGYLFLVGSNILLAVVFQQRFVSLEFLQEKKSTHPSAAAAKSLQSCPTLCDPTESAHQALPSLGFSRREHWSGWQFPSPMRESKTWKWIHSVVSDS